MTDTHARVLVVEDEPYVAEGIRLHLEALGYTVEGPVRTAAEALQAAAAAPPDLVLMDVVLPGGVDGVAVAAQLLQQGIPVVYLTAHADDALLQRAKITEPCGYLVKPCGRSELHATLVLALYRHRMKQQLGLAQSELERKVSERTAHLADLNRRLVQEAAERVRIEEALRESEHHLRQIIDLVPNRIFVKDAEGRFLLVNRAVADDYGMDVETMVGCRHADLHGNSEQVARMLADDRFVIESGKAKVNFEETFTGVDGCPRMLRTTKLPYRLRADNRPAVLGLAIDITEEKHNEWRLAASEQKYRAMLEHAVDAILLADMQGNIVDANRRAEELLAYSRDELCRMHAIDLHPESEHERVREVFQTLGRSGTTLVQHAVRRKDGSLLQVEVAAVLIRFDDGCVIQGIFRDVTERERRSKERLAQEWQHRDTLVREVHHRIKNNLQGVIGLLRQQANVHPELAELIGTAIGQVQSISVVYGLHGQGEDMQIRLCDMVSAIARNASTLTRSRVEPDVQLAIRQPVQISQDEAVPVALVVNELILNAIKHGSGPSGWPEVCVIVDQTDQYADVRVIGGGRLPAGFDYARGEGLGTGLRLVRSLLPHAGAELSFFDADHKVEARLRLASPVVRV